MLLWCPIGGRLVSEPRWHPCSIYDPVGGGKGDWQERLPVKSGSIPGQDGGTSQQGKPMEPVQLSVVKVVGAMALAELWEAFILEVTVEGF